MSDSEIDFEYEDEYDSDVSLESNSIHLEDNEDNNQIRYESWTLPNFIQLSFINKAINLQKMQLSKCPLDSLIIMLQYKNWEVDKLINDYFDDKSKLYEECGIVDNPKNKLTERKDFSCLVCCDSYSEVKTYSLTCGHAYCINCYRAYIRANLHLGSLIRCIDEKCNFTIPHVDLEEIISQQENESKSIVVEKSLNCNTLLRYNARIYIERHKLSLKWCPAPDCDNLTQLLQAYDPPGERDNDISHIPIVKCAENHEFCYECQYENHLPCPCWIVKIWVKKCNDDSATVNWIQANTQSCPKCDSVIEKNGGCNHMVCSKCRYEFCWICSKDWAEHGTSYYRCNRFDPNETAETERFKTSKRLSLQRYLHFYTRFSAHQSSMKADQRTLEKVNEKMKLYMQKMSEHDKLKNLSWVDIQYLHDAIRSLSNGRKTLKWTYCFAFYLGSSNFSQIFEQNQDFLSKTVEDLSEIFEKINHKSNNSRVDIIQEYKSQIINLSTLISLRQATLIKGAESELKLGLLFFET